MSNNYFWHQNEFFNQVRGVTNGGQVCPQCCKPVSYLMGQGVCFFTGQFKYYRRLINDIMIVGERRQEDLVKFLLFLNNNPYDIKLTGGMESQIDSILDLEIFKEGSRLNTRTYFKTVDKNGYVNKKLP